MAILTIDGHVSRAVDFYKRGDIYFGIGKSTEWTEDNRTESTPDSRVVNEYNPPRPELTSELEGLLGVKKVERMYLVVPDVNGSLLYRDTRWSVVGLDDAFNEGARWVYLSTSLSYNELPIDISYRQIGIMTGVQRVEGVDPSKYTLELDEISDQGITEVIDYRKPIYRELDQREELVLIVEF